MKILGVIMAICLIAGCGPSGSGGDAAADWWRWHGDKQAIDLAVSEAINMPNGGDYAKAVDIMRASNWPDVVKQFEIGLLIIGSFDSAKSRRPKETLSEGLAMVEAAVARPGEPSKVGPQQLRLLFERGAGIAPHMIPKDALVAECWRKLENHEAGDPRRCIVLRKERLPQLG